MTDRERVLKGLECLITNEIPCEGCPYYGIMYCQKYIAKGARELIKNAPTVNGWISVKDRLPEEHDSMFAQLYGTSKWNGAMWRTESERVLVAILFPDGTRTVDKGKLQDGEWRTGVARVLPQKVTHWAVWPEPPKEDEK